jgi:zinc transport system substrate-binding protein
MLKSVITVWLAAGVLGAAAAPAAAQHTGKDKLQVVVSILPQAYFLERVGGEHVAVEVLVGAGQSPHTYEPTPKQLAALSAARVYFRIGIDFEVALVPRLESTFKNLKIIDTRAGVPLRQLTVEEGAADEHDEHGPGKHDQHGADQHESQPKAAVPHDARAAGQPDPHIWLNPLYVKTQARTICDALAELDPPHADDYRRNLAAFHADLDRVHAKLAAALAPLKGREIFVFHPAFGYFTDAYGLKQAPVEIEGKDPTAKQLAALIERAKADRVRVIFVQPQFSEKAAQAVAQAIGGAVVPMDDLPRDYLKNLEDMAENIRTALKQKGE